jgi:hypothetical protein
MRTNFLVDAQQALGFLVAQTSYIEPQVVEVQYPDIQYPDLIPVDTSADEWAKSVTYYSTNKFGVADWFHHMGKDMPMADSERAKHEVGIEMAAIGYFYTLEELSQAMRVPGTNLSAERASAARRAYEEFVDNVAFNGDASKNFSGFINYPGVSRIDAAPDGTSDRTDWEAKTAEQILRDVNDAIVGQWVASLQVELANTVLLPVTSMALLATKIIPNTTMTVLEFLNRNNIYTFQTGQQLMIRGVRGLETAGTNDSGRMIVYRRDPAVVKMHIPMTHRFLPV